MTFDEKGFYRRGQDEILTEMNEDTKLKFGDQVKLDSHHLLGQLNQILSNENAKTEELIEAFYNQIHVQTATGVHLDRLGWSYSRLSRLPATVSQVKLNITGTPGYVIPEQTYFETENGITFMTIEEVTVAKSQITNEDNQKTDETDEDGNLIGRVSVNAVSSEVGYENNVPSNSIESITEPVEELFTVINPEISKGGSDIETDTDYRKRILAALDMQPGPTANGIINGVKNVPGVQQVKIVNNVTNQTDKYGNPGHTIHLYVLGGPKEDILVAIKNCIAFGIESMGEQEGYVADISGDKHLYRFDYSKAIESFIKLKIKTTDEWNVDSGVDDVKNTISNYLKTLQMGDTLHFSKLYQYIYQVAGIDFVDLTLGTDKSNLTMNDIQPDVFEVVTSSLDNIEVIIDE